uniref:Putative site-specific DNA endonuclease n=1 Tax=Pleodorina starrii TaxID=330485 RepID=M9P8F3_9CHLO|nr:putative site-specific DNA endonuclease [Pleodorina starrii]YP_007890195.1 putative site-specific DNA endonuclease [Pleodorina starrii]AFY64422.1 putative site-specific DNA endonuclease [Pleodorina starrii]AFY64463.1 putative site-specific DNA endonuclease [Pleodorina starrii]
MFTLTDENYFWLPKIKTQAQKWDHVIYGITGCVPTRRSEVLWSCSKHPDTGSGIFQHGDQILMKLLADKKHGLTETEIQDLIMTYPGQAFYATRMDLYLKNRTICCRPKLYSNRKKEGYKIFQNLLAKRGDHYNTKYTLLINATDYPGKHYKIPIKCEIHNLVVQYSMHELNTITSCPCPLCRKDPNHKNVAVDIVKRRNAGRLGQVIRHAQRVKEKYKHTCALSNSKYNLQHHHLDGQDFYPETRLVWEHNGICLCSTVHLDYHNNFLKIHSLIATKYSNVTFSLNKDELINVEDNQEIDSSNPDFSLGGAEVSRYTFLEYLRFLIFDIKSNNSQYVNTLNQKMASEHRKINPSSPSFGELGKITLETLEKAIKKYRVEFVGNNWALSSRKDIFFANNIELWNEVENTWQ